MFELEEEKKKSRIAETKAFLHCERTLKEQEKVKKLKDEKTEQNLLNASYESWSSGSFASDLNNTLASVVPSSRSPTPSQPNTRICDIFCKLFLFLDVLII